LRNPLSDEKRSFYPPLVSLLLPIPDIAEIPALPPRRIPDAMPQLTGRSRREFGEMALDTLFRGVSAWPRRLVRALAARRELVARRRQAHSLVIHIQRQSPQRIAQEWSGMLLTGSRASNAPAGPLSS
jgi:hypothetical protein